MRWDRMKWDAMRVYERMIRDATSQARDCGNASLCRCALSNLRIKQQLIWCYILCTSQTLSEPHRAEQKSEHIN